MVNVVLYILKASIIFIFNIYMSATTLVALFNSRSNKISCMAAVKNCPV